MTIPTVTMSTSLVSWVVIMIPITIRLEVLEKIAITMIFLTVVNSKMLITSSQLVVI